MTSKPKPFRRPSIDLGKHGRTWNRILVRDILPGDVVQGQGLIMEVKDMGNGKTRLVFMSRDEPTFSSDHELVAFCRKGNPSE